jgi:predicted nucleotide-binding protein (sugar kinase/HSP70/actin superfamily)
VRAVEEAGGEAWLAPLSEWFLYTGFMQKWHARHRGDLKGMIRAYLKDTYLHRREKRLYARIAHMVGDRVEPDIEEIMERSTRYIPVNFGGEATLTLGRAALFAENGAQMIVNVAPFSCMPGTITTALFNHIQKAMGIPVVNLFFDGKSGESRHIKTYVENLPDTGHS